MTLGVLAAYRGRGIGRKLVQSILDYYYHGDGENVRSNDDNDSNNDSDITKSSIPSELVNVQQIALHVQTSNEDAMKFYVDKFGFQKGELVENYYRRIDPPHCYILRKTLS